MHDNFTCFMCRGQQLERNAPCIAADDCGPPEATNQPNPAPFVTKYKEYTIPGNFNVLTGKFQRLTESEHWAQKGLPTDRDIRQLAHYMDVQSEEVAGSRKKQTRVTAKQIQKFKKDKEEKKRKKLLQAYFDQ